MTWAGLLDQGLIVDPSVTGLNRLPMRGAGSFADEVDQVRNLLDDRDLTDEWAMSLDGQWDFVLLDSPEDVSRSVISGPSSRGTQVEIPPPTAAGKPGTPPRTWTRIAVPGAWTLQGPEVVGDGNRAFEPPRYTNVVMPFEDDPPLFPRANPTGVYRRAVKVPRKWKGRQTVLRVGAAESVVQVFIDGQLVGGGTDSRLPNEFDVSEFVTPGRRFELSIVVVKWSAQTWVEDQDQWWHGGIQRSVTMYSVPESHFEQVKLLPGFEQGTGTVDFEVRLTGAVVREPGWSVEALVETVPKSGRNPRLIATTGLLEVPAWDDDSEASSLLSGMFIEPGVVRGELRVADVAPWSHETPNLYRSIIILRDPRSKVVASYGTQIGFRSVEIADNQLLINGQPVLIHGVNLHEHSPETGRAVTRELTSDDLVMMKAHNLNAVRAAHYPHDEHLAELCDELGLYLVDEANIESHARQASLCHDGRFTQTMLERVRRMAERDQHHPSIIIWSLGNESGYGAVHDAAAAWLRRYDPTRPVQYEGPFMHDLYANAPVSDVVCPMYPTIEQIVGWAKSGKDKRRPLILCEYSHAMGNSNGSLADYWDAFESVPGLQGGFIWEWVDHGLKLFDNGSTLLTGPDSRPSWGYGGDFGDTPNDSNFVCDGLVSADRVPRPAIAEVHYVGRPVTARLTHPLGQTRPKVRLANRRWFCDTSDLRLSWELSVDGDVVGFGEFDPVSIPPRSEATVALPFKARLLANVTPGAEVHLSVIASLRRRTAWAHSGHVVGIDQVVIPLYGSTKPPGSGAAGGRSGADSMAPVAAAAASTPELDWSQISWRPTVFRALTDNDGLRQGWMRGLVGNLARWVDEQGLDNCDWRPGAPRIKTLDPPGGGLVQTTQSGELVTGGGAVVKVRSVMASLVDRWTRLELDVRVPAELADLPRVGFEFHLSGSSPWMNLDWFGEGPHECYPDRRAAARVGRWRTPIDQVYVDHSVPQEHGHRTGLRWLALTRAGSGRRREGLLVVAESSDGSTRPGFAVRRHSDDQLWRASHSHELSALDGSGDTYLYLDVTQRGVGTGSCGPDTLPQYRVKAGRHQLVVWFCGFDPRREDPGMLARTLRS